MSRSLRLARLTHLSLVAGTPASEDAACWKLPKRGALASAVLQDHATLLMLKTLVFMRGLVNTHASKSMPLVAYSHVSSS